MSEQNNLATSSKGQYAGRNKTFLVWLWESEKHRGLLNDRWVALVCEQAGVRVPGPGATFKQAAEQQMGVLLAVKDAKATAPVHYVDGLCDAWLQFIHALDVEFATQSTYRSAFGHLWSNFHGPEQGALPAPWEAKIAAIFKGLARTKASEKASGKKGRPERGKKPLEFQTYGLLCELGWGSVQEIQPTKSIAVANSFVGLFMTLQWNLMSRSKNVTGIAFPHISWVNDSLSIMFCVTKTNQAGRNMHPRHVYANPLMPHICPILALGVYLMTHSFGEDNALFPGQKQYSRFSKLLDALVKCAPKSRSLESESFRIYGTHSFRKGAATFACSGSTAAPHISAVSNRAGWKQPGVQDTYLVYADAGDQYVGRVVAGLPLSSHNFSILPPFFNEVSEHVRRALDLCFPSVQGRIDDRVLVFCLASVVYHRTWLGEKLRHSHAIFRAPIFLDQELLVALASQVRCHLPESGGMLKATGVPPHVDQLLKLERVEQVLEKMCHHIEEKCDGLVEGVLQGLDERQVESHLTPTGLRNQLRVMMDEVGLSDLRSLLGDQRRLSAGVGPPAHQEQARAPLQGCAVFSWDGLANRLLPADFGFPRSASVRDMWFLYIVGIPSTGVRPLKDISRDHFRAPDARKRACEFFQLMHCIEANVRKSGAWSDSQSLDAASRMFESGKNCFAGLSKSARNYHRRAEQLGWRRAHDLIVRRLEKKGKQNKRKVSFDALEDMCDVDEDEDEDSDDVVADVNDNDGGLVEHEDDDDEGEGPSAGKRQEPSASSHSSGVDEEADDGAAKALKLLARSQPAVDRSPGGDVHVAYAKLVSYCEEVLHLYENTPVIGDGACMFRLAVIQLRTVIVDFDAEFEGDAVPAHSRIRYRCAQWVYQTYQAEDDHALQSVGYRGWRDWLDKMLHDDHYGDELCIDAISELFHVRICIIFAGIGEKAVVSHRFIGNAANPLVYFGIVGDHHCYSFAPILNIARENQVLKKQRVSNRRVK